MSNTGETSLKYSKFDYFPPFGIKLFLIDRLGYSLVLFLSVHTTMTIQCKLTSLIVYFPSKYAFSLNV